MFTAVLVHTMKLAILSKNEHIFESNQSMFSHLKQHFEDKIEINNKTFDLTHSKFYYFNLHNLNKDAYIDGLELMKVNVSKCFKKSFLNSRASPILTKATLFQRQCRITKLK